jgi:hypothetical protein
MRGVGVIELGHIHNPLTRGPAPAPKLSAVTAHTSASSRSGERSDDNPSRPKSHISSSSAGNAPACFTRPCSYNYAIATGARQMLCLAGAE